MSRLSQRVRPSRRPLLFPSPPTVTSTRQASRSASCVASGRSVLIDAGNEAIRNRRLCGGRLVCTRALPHGSTCTGQGHLTINHAGRWAVQLARTPNRVFRR